MLRFQAKRPAVFIGFTTFERIGPLHEITAIELYAGFFRQYLHHDPAEITGHCGCRHQLVPSFDAVSLYGVNDEIVVISPSVFQLDMVGTDT